MYFLIFKVLLCVKVNHYGKKSVVKNIKLRLKTTRDAATNTATIDRLLIDNRLPRLSLVGCARREN